MSIDVAGPIIGVVVLLVLLVLLITSRYKVAGPNQAFIVTGRKGKAVLNPESGELTTDLSGQKVVLGGGVFVVPFIQKLATMDLSSRRISVHISGAVSGQGIKLNLDGVAIVKIGGNADQIRLGAQRFLSQQADIEGFTQEVLAGALRSIVGGLTVEQIIRDRAAFAQRVADESEASLTGQGLILDAFQIQDVTDDGTYLADLGRPEAARIQQAASIAEANARQAAEQARIAAEQEIAISQRTLALKQAEIKAETDAAAAQAAAAGPLAQAERDQAIFTEQEKVAVRQAALTERQLETQVRKPADAERYRVEQEANAHKSAQILAAEAEKARRTALADAVKAEGEAQAAATLAVGQAEAGAMEKRAAAFANYNEAAVLQMLIEVLPQIAKEVAAPISAIDNLTVLSTDGAGAMPKQVVQNVAQTLEMLKATTGLDLESLLHKAIDKSAAAPVVAGGAEESTEA
ncbi:flotillin family protein [Nocardioides humilatus]|uniref:Flotillin family protein n=1 Tax=Nocardioides humilatus TaxID=2607660 RepID=A0A5B1L5S2_9ACTN|nr:flotillin family protein [Nocardioides humilatus]KAA1415508.1 flotillin family protein [Nocardioides humilatus]